MIAESSAPGPSKSALPKPRLRTYIVEDSPVIRENLIATLEELGPIEVVGTAEDESSALQWMSQHASSVDLAIIDIFLKQGSGLGVLKAAGAMPGHHTMVVLSNYATSEMRRKCLELGAARVFDKSNEIDDLLNYCCRLAAGDTGRGDLA
jgi:DNA-binding NarL/FixJ family response regulator